MLMLAEHPPVVDPPHDGVVDVGERLCRDSRRLRELVGQGPFRLAQLANGRQRDQLACAPRVSPSTREIPVSPHPPPLEPCQKVGLGDPDLAEHAVPGELAALDGLEHRLGWHAELVRDRLR
jgi:hypothetical protein